MPDTIFPRPDAVARSPPPLKDSPVPATVARFSPLKEPPIRAETPPTAHTVVSLSPPPACDPTPSQKTNNTAIPSNLQNTAQDRSLDRAPLPPRHTSLPPRILPNDTPHHTDRPCFSSRPKRSQKSRRIPVRFNAYLTDF